MTTTQPTTTGQPQPTTTAQPTVTAPATPTSTWREDLLCALAAYWAIGGLYLDGWAHVHRPGLETFFTPWHGALYSGFAVLAAGLVAAVVRRRDPAVRPRRWIPAGYGLGLLGAAVFVAGGGSDLVWHQLLGVEVSLEALLSPPHLVLLTGGTLMVTTALRSTVARHGGLPARLLPSLPAILAVAGAAAVAGFFLSYASPFTDIPAAALRQDWQSYGLAQYLIGTAVLVVPVLLAYAVGGRIPPGLITAVVAAVALPAGVFSEFRWLSVQLGAIAGGAVADATAQWVQARAAGLTALVAAVAVPALVWSGQLLAVAATVGIAWSAELWAGVVVLTALAGAVLGGLVRAGRRPPAGHGSPAAASPGTPDRPG